MPRLVPTAAPSTVRDAALALSILLGLSGSARGGVNELTGRVGFSNANPEILSVLGAPGNAGLASVRVTATSQPPAPFSVHDATLVPTGPVTSDWTLQVAADAAGTTFRVVTAAELGAGPLRDDYYFLTVTSPPVLDEPAPDTPLDILECAGLIRVRYLDEAGSPVAVQGDRVTADSSLGGVSPLGHVAVDSTTKDVVVRGDGSTYTVRIEITHGTDPFSNRMTQLRTATAVVGCDEIVEVPVTVTTPGSAELGSIRGRLDIVGEDEIVSAGALANVRSRIEGTGPQRNLRADAIPGPPSEGAWSLENLVASSVVSPAVPWVVKAETAFGSGQDFASFLTPSISTMVDPGQSVDVGDAFVLTPVEISGSVLLAGPEPDPTGGSPLQDLWRASDRDANRDGIPDDVARLFDSTVVTGRGLAGVAPGATGSALGATGYAIVAGAWDPATAAVSGHYRLVLGNLGSEPGYYAADELNLKLLDTTTPATPATYLDTRVDIADPGPRFELAAGDAGSRDRAYCLSTVIVGLADPVTPFYAPDVAGSGSFAGTDFLGAPATYDATLWWGRGTPNAISRAALSGQSVLLLPQGTWMLDPSVRVPNGTGGSTLTPLPSFTVEVGCRQSLEVRPEVQVAVTSEAPRCSASDTLAVTAHAHADEGLDSVTWSVNGGASQLACTACGVDRDIVFDASLRSGDNVVRIEAIDLSGRRATAQVTSRRATEPSALDVVPGATPLRVAKDPGGLRLTWEPEPRDIFAIHRGTVDSLHAGAYDHVQDGGCDIAGSAAVIAVPGDDAYFLVTSSCGAGTGSYGRSSRGGERPSSANGCR